MNSHRSHVRAHNDLDPRKSRCEDVQRPALETVFRTGKRSTQVLNSDIGRVQKKQLRPELDCCLPFVNQLGEGKKKTILLILLELIVAKATASKTLLPKILVSGQCPVLLEIRVTQTGLEFRIKYCY